MNGKNILDNGNFNIVQRGTTPVSGSAPSTKTASLVVAQTYTADRWFVRSQTTACVTVNMGTAPVYSGSKYSLGITGAGTGGTTATHITLSQRIEASTAIQTMAISATYLSFWAYNGESAAGALTTPQILTWYPTAADTWTSGTANAQVTTTAATQLDGSTAINNWSKWGFPIPASTHYVTGAEIDIDFGSIAATYFVLVDQCQLEVGTSVTNFDVLPPAVELARCQRFYEVQGGTADYPHCNVYYLANGVDNYLRQNYPWAVVKASSSLLSQGAVGLLVGSWTSSNITGSLGAIGNKYGYSIYAYAGGSTQPVIYYPTNSTGLIVGSCDL